jgi:hypothetical protein
MPKLYNNETGQIEDVPFQEVNNAIESGTYGFQAGPAVPLENPSGEVYLMPADKAAEIIQDHSWRFPSQEKTTNFFNDLQKDVAKADEEARLEEEYGDAPLQAGFFGATRGLTLGLSDPLWRSLGVSAERLRELEERQPGISTTAEIGGALVPLLLPEPTSTTGAAARLGLLAARGVTGASAQAGKVAARALGKKIAGQAGKQTLARAAAPLALGGAVEGALYGIGETISEDALENKEMSAEAFVGNIGIGTLLGGAGGVLLGGGKEIIQRSARSRMAARLLDERQARDFKRRVLENAQRDGRRVSVNDPRPLLQIMDNENLTRYAPRDKKGKISHGGFGRAIKEKIVGGVSLVTNADKKLLDEFFSANPEAAKLRRWAFATHSEKMDLATSFREQVELMYKKSEELVKGLTGAEKYAQVNKLLRDQDVAPVKAAAMDMIERFIEVVDDMKSKPDIYQYKSAIENINLAIFGEKNKTPGLIGKIENANSAFQIFKILDKTKKQAIDPHLKFGKMLVPTEAETINHLARKIRLPIKVLLENKKVFGEAASLQKKINNAASDYLDFEDMFKRNFTFKHYKSGRPIYTVGDNKIVSFLNMRGRFHATSSPQKMTGPGGYNELVEQQNTIQELAESLDPQTRKFKKILAGEEGGEIQEMDDIIDQFTEHNSLRQKSWDELVLGKDRMILKEGMTGLQKSIDKISENLAQMQENWAASFKLKDLAGGSKTQTTISTIQKAEEVLRSTKEKMKRSVLNMIKPAAKGAKAATRAAKAEGSAMEGGVKLTEELKGREPKTPEEEQERFKKETDEISQLKADPSLMISRLGINLDELSMAAPEVAMNVTQTAQRAIEYAYKNIPTSPLNGEVLSDNFQPSREQLYRWRTVMRAIEDPMVITDQIASGFIVPKTLEAVQEVYPEMLNELRKITLEEAAKQPKISIQQQMLISQVMGVAGPYRKMTPGLQATYQQPIGTGLQRRTNKVQNLDRLFKTPVQGIA